MPPASKSAVWKILGERYSAKLWGKLFVQIVSSIILARTGRRLCRIERCVERCHPRRNRPSQYFSTNVFPRRPQPTGTGQSWCRERPAPPQPRGPALSCSELNSLSACAIRGPVQAVRDGPVPRIRRKSGKNEFMVGQSGRPPPRSGPVRCRIQFCVE